MELIEQLVLEGKTRIVDQWDLFFDFDGSRNEDIYLCLPENWIDFKDLIEWEVFTDLVSSDIKDCPLDALIIRRAGSKDEIKAIVVDDFKPKGLIKPSNTKHFFQNVGGGYFRYVTDEELTIDGCFDPETYQERNGLIGWRFHLRQWFQIKTRNEIHYKDWHGWTYDPKTKIIEFHNGLTEEEIDLMVKQARWFQCLPVPEPPDLDQRGYDRL